VFDNRSFPGDVLLLRSEKMKVFFSHRAFLPAYQFPGLQPLAVKLDFLVGIIAKRWRMGTAQMGFRGHRQCLGEVIAWRICSGA